MDSIDATAGIVPAASPRLLEQVSSTDYPRRVLAGLDTLRRSGTHWDYTVTTCSLRMHVHRAVLIASSDYFRALLTGDMRESQEDEVVLDCITETGLESVVDFMYTGSLMINLDVVQEILHAATYLQVVDAVDLCTTYLTDAFSLNNCVELLSIADLYSLANCTYFRLIVLSYFVQLAEEYPDQLMNASAALLATFLSDDALDVPSELWLFELVVRWVRFDLATREQHFAQLISNIRLPLCSREELEEKVLAIDLVLRNDQCRSLVGEALQYHASIYWQPLMQSSRTQVRGVYHKLVQINANIADFGVNEISGFDLASGAKSCLCAPPLSMHCLCVAVVNNFLFVCGQHAPTPTDEMEDPLASLVRYDPRFNTWCQLAPSKQNLGSSAVVAFDRCLLVIGGLDYDGAVPIRTVERYSIADNEWNASTPLPGRPRDKAVCFHKAAVCCSRVYLSGGMRDRDAVRDVLSFDPVDRTWHDEPPLSFARMGHAMASVGDRLFVFGGTSTTFECTVAAVEMFDPLSGDLTWTTCKAELNIVFSSVAILGGSVYIVGKSEYDDSVHEVHVYSPDEDRLELVNNVRLTSISHRSHYCLLLLPHNI